MMMVDGLDDGLFGFTGFRGGYFTKYFAMGRTPTYETH